MKVYLGETGAMVIRGNWDIYLFRHETYCFASSFNLQTYFCLVAWQSIISKLQTKK